MITQEQKALELALEALENPNDIDEYNRSKYDLAIITIKAALKNQEPAVQFHVENRTNSCSDVCDAQGKVYATCAWNTDASKRAERICNLLNTTPLQRKPLTEDEAVSAVSSVLPVTSTGGQTHHLQIQHKHALEITRAVEAAHGIGVEK